MSPAIVNNGEGWTDKHAKEWLYHRDLSASMAEDPDYLRAPQGQPYTKGCEIEMRPIDIGVEVLRCIP